jgi:hypothetical protein
MGRQPELHSPGITRRPEDRREVQIFKPGFIPVMHRVLLTGRGGSKTCKVLRRTFFQDRESQNTLVAAVKTYSALPAMLSLLFNV